MEISVTKPAKSRTNYLPCSDQDVKARLVDTLHRRTTSGWCRNDRTTGRSSHQATLALAVGVAAVLEEGLPVSRPW